MRHDEMKSKLGAWLAANAVAIDGGEDYDFSNEEIFGKDAWGYTTPSLPNGYSASIVCNRNSYGNQRDLYELAVIRDGKLVYDTPITSDVRGHLTPSDVIEILNEIADLDYDTIQYPYRRFDEDVASSAYMFKRGFIDIDAFVADMREHAENLGSK